MMLHINQGGLLFRHDLLGKKGERRSFKPAGFDEWSWLHYRESVLCYYCSCASKKNLLSRGLLTKREETYTRKGYTNWKDACCSFR